MENQPQTGKKETSSAGANPAFANQTEKETYFRSLNLQIQENQAREQEAFAAEEAAFQGYGFWNPFRIAQQLAAEPQAGTRHFARFFMSKSVLLWFTALVNAGAVALVVRNLPMVEEGTGLGQTLVSLSWFLILVMVAGGLLLRWGYQRHANDETNQENISRLWLATIGFNGIQTLLAVGIMIFFLRSFQFQPGGVILALVVWLVGGFWPMMALWLGFTAWGITRRTD
ncbi:MAG: hypothetical protein K1Y36_27350 [Blastocatellia bacterium]|nr:hypothetical protein [Blastocatellia bacterium]